MILRHILETMLSFAVKVFDKELPDDDDAAKFLCTPQSNRIARSKTEVSSLNYE